MRLIYLMSFGALFCASISTYAYADEHTTRLQSTPVHVLDTVTTPDGETQDYAALLAQHKLTGLSFAVVDNYQIVYEKYLGEKQFGGGELIGDNTAFSTASITKAIFGTMLIMLEEQGKLDLDTPVSAYLKRWSLPRSPLTENNPITFTHLLTHTAGTSQHGFTDFYQGDDIPTIIDSLNGKLPRYNKPISVDFTPGSSWKYSGGGYVIAQVAVEDHLGKSIAQLAEELLFEPLGMHNTTLYQDGEKGFLTDVAKVHDKEQKVIKTGIPICPQIAPSGMWSTPRDMAKLVIEMQKALAGNSTKVISQTVAKRATELQTLAGIGGWSMGWMRYEGFGNIDWFSHGGANTGTGGHIMGSMQDGRALLIFGNGPNQSRIPVINAVRDSIIKKLNWTQAIAELPEGFTDAQKQQLTGRYVAPFNDIVEIKELDDGLHMVSQFFTSKLYPLANNQFAMDDFANTYGLKTKKENGRDYLTYYRPGTALFHHAMAKLDKSRKLPAEIAQGHSVEATLKAYKQWKQDFPESHLYTARIINRQAYGLLSEGEHDTAITLLTVYTLLYPKDANAFDSLGEAYMLKGNTSLAIKNYELSLELNPDNQNAVKMLKELKSKA